MPIIDLHCDTIYEIYKNKESSKIIHLEDADLQINKKHLKHASYFLQCFAMFVKNIENDPYDVCLRMIDTFYEELQKTSDLEIIYTYNDIINNLKNNKLSAMLTIEEGGVIQGDLNKLRYLYGLGVRMICLNWNYENGIGYPNYGKYIGSRPDYITPDIVHGLTAFGRQMVCEMNRLGIIIDVSHLSDKGFWDVLSISTKPIVASHSNSRAICRHVRNLSDEMILALKSNGGVMGMNYCATFLDDNEEQGKFTIECVIQHMKYIKKLAGVEVLALGSDFDGIDSNIEMKNASMVNELILRMRMEGFTEEEIEKITYKNALRVFKENLL